MIGAVLRVVAVVRCQMDMFYLHLKETEFRFNHRRDRKLPRQGDRCTVEFPAT